MGGRASCEAEETLEKPPEGRDPQRRQEGTEDRDGRLLDSRNRKAACEMVRG